MTIERQSDATYHVWLPTESYMRAIMHAVAVRCQCVARGAKHSYHSEPDPVRQYQNHCWGSLAENAVEHLLQALGHPVVRIYSFEGGSARPDLSPNVQVRWSRHAALRLHPTDPHEHLFFLVTGDQPFRVWGYRRPPHPWVEGNNALFVPAQQLNRDFKEAPCQASHPPRPGPWPPSPTAGHPRPPAA